MNGTVLSEPLAQFFDLVAVYHPGLDGAPWFPRPCSGVLVRSSAGFSYVMTARHCVTTDLTIGGTIVAPSRIRVQFGARPGLASPNPPATAVVADDVQGMPVSSAGGEARDIAMIRVRANWGPFVRKHGLAVSAPNTFNNLPVYAFGYGISTFDTGCFEHTQNTVTTGAGIARMGAPFTAGSGSTPFPGGLQGGFYSYVNSNGGNPPQSIICGDSGGPDFTPLAGAWHILGVHSTGTGSTSERAVSTAAGTWVQDTLGGLYLSPDSMPNYNFAVTSSWVPFLAPNTGSAQTLRYDPATQRINAAGLSRCLVPAGGEPMAPCQDIALQRWAVGADRRIVHVQSGLCLTAANIQVSAQPCNGSSAQRWQFHAQSKDPPPNLALGKSVTGSPVVSGGALSRAVDGNASGEWAENSVTHSDFRSQPWWQVDLGSSQWVTAIDIFNRADCCAERLTNFNVMTSPDGSSWTTTNVPGTGGRPTNVTVNRQARYVKVQLVGTNYLSLAEVFVWGL
ncbi:MAG TPA: discoidin domain-containing protein [Polyangiaceae bacterium]